MLVEFNGETVEAIEVHTYENGPRVVICQQKVAPEEQEREAKANRSRLMKVCNQIINSRLAEIERGEITAEEVIQRMRDNEAARAEILQKFGKLTIERDPGAGEVQDAG